MKNEITESLKNIADFTLIKHVPRVKFSLSNNDYCIASAIYTLSHNPDSKFLGWYYGKIETLGKKFNLGRSTAYNCVDKLIEKKLVVKDEKSGFLKTTKLWWSEFESIKLVRDK